MSDDLPAGWAGVLARLESGAIAPPIALAQLMLAGSGTDLVERLAGLASRGGRIPEVAALAAAQADRLPAVQAMVASGLDPAAGLSGEAVLAHTRAVFDRLSVDAPEAAVAIYSLGDPALLDAATAELVAVIEAWSPPEKRDVLDFGCGIGRVAVALAPMARSVIGIDVSAGMVERARERAGDLPGVFFLVGDGSGLDGIADASIDLVVAADSFPFLIQAGLLPTLLGEFARVLRPGGELLVFNWSYRGDDEIDLAEARAAPGFALVRGAERPFAIWDGVGFQLRRTA